MACKTVCCTFPLTTYKEKTSLDVPLLDVAMNASTLQEYLKQQNKWANLETSNAIPKEMNASFMGFVLRSANEGISQKRVGNSKWPKQKRSSSPLPLLAVTLKGGSTVNKIEGVAATTAEITTREAFGDFFPTMVVEG
ncbi:hypothetical protein GOBAR_AA17569 [Gossypium barbadense]|uniref:Uncharacterized protein n=1 Tax=Gossypium barbadense TaxID=3634 RepID=A0A2P5XIC3_GOSBA|nr:hypothetical protein GOBAR_AA17569 [Gossypium barbadense]